MTAPFLLTAATYWEARQREGWFYCPNPRKQWYAVHRLGDQAYEMAKYLQCLGDLDFSTRPIKYPGELLDAAWARLIAKGQVQLWRDVPEAVVAKLP